MHRPTRTRAGAKGSGGVVYGIYEETIEEEEKVTQLARREQTSQPLQDAIPGSYSIRTKQTTRGTILTGRNGAVFQTYPCPACRCPR